MTIPADVHTPSGSGRLPQEGSQCRSVKLACAASVMLAAACHGEAKAPWENLNPGAGGRIQDVVLDPNTPGRAFYLSDMEGVSRTDDYGETWEFVGRDTSRSMTLTAAVEPGNPDRVYLGTRIGIEISDNGGRNWRRVPQVDDPINQIAVDPQNPDRIYAVTSNTMRWRRSRWLDKPAVGPRLIWLSRDRGKTWQSVRYAEGEGRRDTFTVSIHPNRTSTVYIAGLPGLYRSADAGRTWRPVTSPPNTGDCWGADLSPDGRFLYACFQVPDDAGRLVRHTGAGGPARVPTRLFVTPTDQTKWTDLSNPANGGPGLEGLYHFWRPEVSPRSTPTEHQVLLASFSNRTGLYEVQVALPDQPKDSPGATWRHVFYYDNNGRGAGFDFGWEQYSTRPLAWQYTPTTWPRPGIWTTGDQTLFRTRTDQPNWTDDWKALYTQYVRTMEGVRFYRTRGVQCTFVFDCAADGDYIVQATADLAIKESYDGGQSWAVGVQKPRSNSVAIIRSEGHPMVLAHTSPGYGAASSQGSLWLKRLVHRSPRDKWRQIAGGKQNVGGLPNTLYEQIVQDPHDPKRIFIGTIDQGVWLIRDIDAFAASPSDHPAERIAEDPGPRRVKDKGVGMVVDPHTPGRLWVCDDQRLWRGDEQDGRWQWRQLDQPASQMAAGSDGHQTWLYVVAPHEPDNHIRLSRDEGKTWRTVVRFEHVQPLADNPWYRPEHYPMSVHGMVASGRHLYFAYAHWPSGKPYGIFHAAVDSNGTVTSIDNLTGNMPYPFPVRSRVIEHAHGESLYVATRGCGLWRLPLNAPPATGP